jgi:DNA-binding Lrp family transcriptional regulator
MDQTDLEIMEFIRRAPHAQHDEIGKAVGLSRQRVSSRITRLQKARRLRKGYTVDLASLGYKYRHRIDVHIDPIALRKEITGDHGQTHSELHDACTKWAPGKDPKQVNPQEVLAFYILNYVGKQNDSFIIEDVTIILGNPADLCVTVRFKDPETVYRFVTENLRTIPGISSTSTCWEAWSCAEAEQRRLIDARSERTLRNKKSAPPDLGHLSGTRS